MLKKNVSDTLTFLHQERNDFLSEEDIIIPSRKNDHISKEINLDSINLKTPKKSTTDYEDMREAIVNEVDIVIKQAEEYLRDVQEHGDDDTFEQPEKKFHVVIENGMDEIKDNSDYLRETAESEIDEVIKQAEEVVNQKLNDLEGSSNKTLKFSDEVIHIEAKQDYPEEKGDSLGEDVKTLTEDSLDNLESLKDDSISVAQEKSDEAFKFLENEASSPICTPQTISNFLEKESEGEIHHSSQIEQPVSPKSPKSAIPVAKPRKSVEKEKDVDVLFGDDQSKVNNELLTKIPVMKGAKVKTIKKHSKDPLKEFVTLSKDVNWDDDDDDTNEIITTITTEPIVKTTVTKIVTTESTPESLNNKFPALQRDLLPFNISEHESELISKSKIPILKTDNPKTTVTTERITSPNSTKVIETVETFVTSPGSIFSTKSNTVDSDSDEDSRRSPPLKGILKKTTCVRTVGSSSGSDIALHEEGAELSEDESGKFRSLTFTQLLLMSYSLKYI